MIQVMLSVAELEQFLDARPKIEDYEVNLNKFYYPDDNMEYMDYIVSFDPKWRHKNRYKYSVKKSSYELNELEHFSYNHIKEMIDEAYRLFSKEEDLISPLKNKNNGSKEGRTYQSYCVHPDNFERLKRSIDSFDKMIDKELDNEL